MPAKSKKKEVTVYDEKTTVVDLTNNQVISTQQRSLNDLSTAERQTEYVTTIDQNSNTPTGQSGAKTTYRDNDKPANDFKSYINIAGLGANAGVRWRF